MSKVLLVLALSGGCSFALQGKPRDDRACSTSHVPWVVDAAVAAAGVAAMVYGVAEQSDTAMTAAGAGALGSIVFTGSSVSGYRWRRQCAAR